MSPSNLFSVSKIFEMLVTEFFITLLLLFCFFFNKPKTIAVQSVRKVKRFYLFNPFCFIVVYFIT